MLLGVEPLSSIQEESGFNLQCGTRRRWCIHLQYTYLLSEILEEAYLNCLFPCNSVVNGILPRPGPLFCSAALPCAKIEVDSLSGQRLWIYWKHHHQSSVLISVLNEKDPAVLWLFLPHCKPATKRQVAAGICSLSLHSFTSYSQLSLSISRLSRILTNYLQYFSPTALPAPSAVHFLFTTGQIEAHHNNDDFFQRKNEVHPLWAVPPPHTRHLNFLYRKWYQWRNSDSCLSFKAKTLSSQKAGKR